MQKQDKPFNFDKRGLLLTMHEIKLSFSCYVNAVVVVVVDMYAFGCVCVFVCVRNSE